MSDLTDRDLAIQEVIDKADVYSLPSIANLGQKQIETTSISGLITEDGDIIATVTAAGLANSPKAIPVTVLDSDNAYIVATKVASQLASDEDISEFFDISVIGVNINLTTKTPAINDGTMNISIINGSSVGVVNTPVSLTSQEGQPGDLSKVEAIVDRNKIAQRWQAGAVVEIGRTKILPLTPNGRIYKVIKGGTFSSTEPFSSAYVNTYYDSYYSTRIFDNDVILEDAGSSKDNVYDIQAAIREALEMKLAAASKFMNGGGLNMGSIFDNIKRMLDYYDTALVG